MSDQSPWPLGLYVLLDPETDKPQEYAGGFALQSDGDVLCDGIPLDQAQYISSAVNSHQALVEIAEDCLNWYADRCGWRHPMALKIAEVIKLAKA